MEKEKDINEQIEKKAEEKIYEEKKHLKQEVKRYKEKVDKEQKKEKALQESKGKKLKTLMFIGWIVAGITFVATAFLLLKVFI